MADNYEDGWDMEDIYDDVEAEQGYTVSDIFGDEDDLALDDGVYEDEAEDEEDVWDDNYGLEETDLDKAFSFDENSEESEEPVEDNLFDDEDFSDEDISPDDLSFD